MRSGVAFDVLRRWLTAKGYDVAFIRNVTDIDDKILNKAADAGRPWWEWAATYERAFTAAYDALGVLPPSAEPRATGHITQMVELIERLIDNGHAYAGGGDVYFDVLSYPEYGTAVGPPDRRRAPGRGCRPPASATSATSRCGRAPSPASRRGRRRGAAAGPAGTPNASRCASRIWALSSTSTPAAWIWSSRTTRTRSPRPCAAGDGFAQYWLHNGWVTMGGEKMSKSLGNVLAIPAVLQRVRAAELRYYLGSAHYRSMLEFSETALQDAAKAYTGIEDFLHRVRSRVGSVVPGTWTDKFGAALDDDLGGARRRWPRCTRHVRRATARSTRAITTPRWRTRSRSGR